VSLAPTLFIIGTPIGNLSDISPRVRNAIELCDLLLVEDTRVTIKLLNHLGIKKKMLSCHEFNENERLSILEQARNAKQSIGLISDAGMPAVSDPGSLILAAAIKLKMRVEVIAGPSAFLLALIGSGLPMKRFVFEGFLPDKSGDLQRRLEQLQTEERTLVFYVAPHKLNRTLEQMERILGNRQACVARELTKIHEEYIREDISSLHRRFLQTEARGEIVVVVEGFSQPGQDLSQEDIERLTKEYLLAGKSVKDTAHELGRRSAMRKSAIYKLAVEIAQQIES
jgi:16S rRNA (cytidine1402-2'-O)-methyltransferase